MDLKINRTLYSNVPFKSIKDSFTAKTPQEAVDARNNFQKFADSFGTPHNKNAITALFQQFHAGINSTESNQLNSFQSVLEFVTQLVALLQDKDREEIKKYGNSLFTIMISGKELSIFFCDHRVWNIEGEYEGKDDILTDTETEIVRKLQNLCHVILLKN